MTADVSIDSEKVLKNWSDKKDSVSKDSIKSAMGWMDIDKPYLPYEHRRRLPKDVARRAANYIACICEQYPFQLRYTMALPLWERFAEEWCESGEEEKALRAI
jgi:hypothetical protein